MEQPRKAGFFSGENPSEINMTKRTTAKRLGSYHNKVIAEKRNESWESNPRRLPLPTLPDVDYLKGPYLQEIIRSAPNRAREILHHIQTVDGVRSGEIKYQRRRSSERR